ncbi:hypothetical protein E2C01_016479 [Portunus trituberculatus]|uniref:Uncharacterized protein n=1 Tax=Portunus trituberculatus TaxID=210409 RepID=A0A5B7DP78_PORTR|nr:hypothetical protein [Portunus trituberculatus]
MTKILEHSLLFGLLFGTDEGGPSGTEKHSHALPSAALRPVPDPGAATPRPTLSSSHLHKEVSSQNLLIIRHLQLLPLSGFGKEEDPGRARKSQSHSSSLSALNSHHYLPPKPIDHS